MTADHPSRGRLRLIQLPSLIPSMPALKSEQASRSTTVMISLTPTTTTISRRKKTRKPQLLLKAEHRAWSTTRWMIAVIRPAERDEFSDPSFLPSFFSFFLFFFFFLSFLSFFFLSFFDVQ